MICPLCSFELHEGDWPWCNPSGGPHERAGTAQIIDDTVTGGARWFHNLGDEKIWVETKSELKAELSKRGLVQAERNNYCRDDKSPYATRTRLRPGARDPFLQGAK